MPSYDRDALLDAVLARLGEDAELAVLQGERYPASFDEWLDTRLKSPRGAYLVSYAGSRRTLGGEDAPPVSMALDIVLVARPPASMAGRLIFAIEDMLDGHRLALAGGDAFDLAVESDAFTAELDRLLVYTVRVRADLL